MNIGKKSEDEIILSLSTITKLQLQSVDQSGKYLILDFLNFLSDLDNLVLPEPNYHIEVADESFSKIEQAKQLLSNSNSRIDTLLNLCSIYFSQKWILQNENSVLNVFSQALQIFQSIDRFLQRHKELNENEEDENEEAYEEAGIDAIHSYGVFASIYALCDGKPWLYDKLLSCSAESVYITLRFSKDKAKFDSNLTKIKTRQANGNVSGNSK
jgi:hypothetical protein